MVNGKWSILTSLPQTSTVDWMSQNNFRTLMLPIFKQGYQLGGSVILGQLVTMKLCMKMTVNHIILSQTLVFRIPKLPISITTILKRMEKMTKKSKQINYNGLNN